MVVVAGGAGFEFERFVDADAVNVLAEGRIGSVAFLDAVGGIVVETDFCAAGRNLAMRRPTAS